jgi:hypothetical protein
VICTVVSSEVVLLMCVWLWALLATQLLLQGFEG